MSPFANLVVLLIAVYGVAARPADEVAGTTEKVDVRQGWNNQGQQPLNNVGYPGNAPGYPVGGYPDPAAGAYPSGGNSRPAYAYDNAFRDQINFAGADPHSNIASVINAQLPNPGAFLPPIQHHPIQNQVSGFIPTGYQAPSGISASAAVSGKV